MKPAPMLEAEFVVARRSFDVSAHMSLRRGERLSLFGPSGAGKSTCLEALAGLARLKDGSVSIDDRVVNAPRKQRSGARRLTQVEPRERGVAFVRQPTTLFSHLSVGANICYGLERRPGAAALESLLSSVELQGLAGAMPEALSGGQRQRVSFARAIARPFRALLLDEPFSALDTASRLSLRALACQVSSERGAIALLATHDLTEAQAFGDQLAIVDEGRLLQVGPADFVVRNPATVRVAELCGYRNFLRLASGNLAALHPDRYVEGAFPARGAVITGTVRSVQPFGARYSCELVCDPTGDREVDDIVEVHVDAPPHVGGRWEVTGLSPPVVAARKEGTNRRSSTSSEQGGGSPGR